MLERSRIGLGVALLPLVGAAVPLSVGTGTQSPIVAALVFAALLLVAWLGRAVLVGKLRLLDSPVVLPTVSLILVWVLALVASDAVRDPLVVVPPTWTWIQLGGLGVAVIQSGILLLALHAGLEERWIRWATWTFVGVGALAGIALLPPLQQVTDTFLQTGGMFTLWLVALAYGQALFNHTLPLWARAGLGGLAGFWVFKALVLQTWWFSGWLPSLIAVATITLLRSYKVFAVGVVVSVLAVATQFDAIYDAIWGSAIRKGDLTRLDIWSQTLDLVGHYPVLGTGPAGYAVYFQSLYADSHFSLSTHNTYLDVLAQTGGLGCVVFAWFLLAIGWAGWRARGRWRNGFLGGYAQGAFGGFIGLVIGMSQGDWLIPFVYNQTIAGVRYTIHSWVFLGFLSSLALLRPAWEVE